jgi:hypothetical protein
VTSPPIHGSSDDLDGDQRDDLLIVSNQDRLVLFGQDQAGICPLKVIQRFFVGAGPRWAGIGDLNGDGRNDVVVANGNASTLGVFLAR